MVLGCSSTHSLRMIKPPRVSNSRLPQQPEHDEGGEIAEVCRRGRTERSATRNVYRAHRGRISWIQQHDSVVERERAPLIVNGILDRCCRAITVREERWVGGGSRSILTARFHKQYRLYGLPITEGIMTLLLRLKPSRLCIDSSRGWIPSARPPSASLHGHHQHVAGVLSPAPIT